MGRLDYVNCRSCGRSSKEVGELSHTRLCSVCAIGRFEANIDQLRAHSGPFALHHRRQCVAAWGGVLLDDVLASP